MAGTRLHDTEVPRIEGYISARKLFADDGSLLSDNVWFGRRVHPSARGNYCRVIVRMHDRWWSGVYYFDHSSEVTLGAYHKDAKLRPSHTCDRIPPFDKPAWLFESLR